MDNQNSQKNGNPDPSKSSPSDPCHLPDDIELSVPAEIPTKHGVFQIRAVRDAEGMEHAIVYLGKLSGHPEVPVRVHSECLTSEVFHSLRCDCREQLEAALAYFAKEGCGVLIYLRQEGRGIGLFNKIRAYALQDGGLDTVEANTELGLPSDSRTYETAVKILRTLGIPSVGLMTNNPLKIEALRKTGIDVVSRIPVSVPPSSHNDHYLRTKREKMDHLLFDKPE